MPCLPFNLHNSMRNKKTSKSKKTISSPQTLNSTTQHDPWEEETRAIREAMGADIMLTSVAQIPSSVQPRPKEKTLPRRPSRPNIIAGSGVPVNPPSPQKVKVVPYPHVNMDQKGEKWNPLHCSPACLEAIHDDEIQQRTSQLSVDRTVALIHQESRSTKSGKGFEHRSESKQPHTINFSRPLRSTRAMRLVNMKEEQQVASTPGPVCKGSSSSSSRELPAPPPHQQPRAQSQSRSEPRLGGKGIKIGSSFHCPTQILPCTAAANYFKRFILSQIVFCRMQPMQSQTNR